MKVCINRSVAAAVGRIFRAVVSSVAGLAAVTIVAVGCNSGSPTQPQPQPQTPTEVSGTITFANAGPDRAPIASHSESGFVVQFRTGTWEVSTTYGNPAPFPSFSSPSTPNTTAEIHITAGGSVFAFKSVDVYSSLTPIPYAVVGTRSGVKTLEFGDTVPFAGVVGNTFGNFRTVTNASTAQLVDTLTLTLTNPLAFNPMGLDNIVLGR